MQCNNNLVCYTEKREYTRKLQDCLIPVKIGGFISITEQFQKDDFHCTITLRTNVFTEFILGTSEY